MLYQRISLVPSPLKSLYTSGDGVGVGVGGGVEPPPNVAVTVLDDDMVTVHTVMVPEHSP
ncbi:hypothetical protein MBAV_005995 [Candidatus Magnetobacterium bavaricum]|uniref:Uncharacterized protein n=1 Tax=Candidatus Magnetobacterium bavaricum TaxID=29290 RepID=A0A0F3GJ19_9BACT|nr:hypothetical protein MBAV_005995 [Candidatus Magnetobacterium bavaricum]